MHDIFDLLETYKMPNLEFKLTIDDHKNFANYQRHVFETENVHLSYREIIIRLIKECCEKMETLETVTK
jgi:hypothetical protein